MHHCPVQSGRTTVAAIVLSFPGPEINVDGELRSPAGRGSYLYRATPISAVPLVIEANPSVPVKSVVELLAYARQNPGKLKLKVGYAGKVPRQHIGIKMFKWMAKIEMKLVAFAVSAPALQALQAGEVDLMFDPLPSSIGLIRDGKLRALAVTTLGRSPVLPDVPSMSEHVPDYEAGSWFGLEAPRATAADAKVFRWLEGGVCTMYAAEFKESPAAIRENETLGYWRLGL
jgi:hypothetical protein